MNNFVPYLSLLILLSYDGIVWFYSTDQKFGGKFAPEGKGCSRCKYPVYAAEQMISKEKVG